MAGLNCQNISQAGRHGPQSEPGPRPVTSTPPAGPIVTTSTPFQPTVMSHTTATHVDYEREFSPVVELRLEGRYQITRAISFHAGWTGIWMDGIARASSVIDYTVPAMGIDLTDNRKASSSTA